MRWLYERRISHKLIIMFCIVILSVLSLTVFAVNRMNMVVDSYEDLLSSSIMRQVYIKNAKNALSQFRLNTAYAVLSIDNPFIQEVIGDFDLVGELYFYNFSSSIQAFELAVYGIGSTTGGEIQAALNFITDLKNEYLNDIVPAIARAALTDDRELLEDAITTGISLGNMMTYQLDHISYIMTAYTHGIAFDVSQSASRTTNILLAVFLGVTLMVAVSFSLVATMIRRPINALRLATAKVAEGDLRYPIHQPMRDEIGFLSDDIANMVDSISELNKSVTIMEAIEVLLCVVDNSGQVLYLNKAMSEAYGKFDSIHTAQSLTELSAAFGAKTHDEPTNHGMYYEQSASKWFEVHSSFLKWVDGTDAIIYSIIDVTAKKASEDKKNQYEAALEEAVKAAQIASDTKSAFIANTSHEIRTPMNSIMGYTDLALGDESISIKTRNYLDNILANSKWLLQIINDLLDISKIESGKLDIEVVPFDIHQVLSHCEKTISPLMQEKNLALQHYIEPKINKLMLGSPTRITQVLLNLLSNAVKFTDAGFVRIATRLIESTDNICTIKFEISDSGIGMTPEQIKNIFQPFSQADSSIARQYGGFGLGLTITKNLIEAMGGKLSVESVPQIGSMFYFTITFTTMEVKPDEFFDQFGVENLSKPMFDGEVLVCEDNLMNQGVICEHLEKVGLRPVLAANGEMGVDIVKKRILNKMPPFGLVLMDINMPVMDGIEASKRIIAMDETIPVVAMTANVMVGDLASYMESGMKDVIGKPFTSQELWRCLLKYFKPIHWSDEDLQKVLEGKEKLRKKIIKQFVENNKFIVDEIIKNVQDGRAKEAHLLAHNLRTSASIIDQPVLLAIASKVEMILRKTPHLVNNDMLQSLKTAHEAAIRELR